MAAVAAVHVQRDLIHEGREWPSHNLLSSGEETMKGGPDARATLSTSALRGRPVASSRGSRRPGTHLAAFSSVDIRPGIPPSSALRCTHLDAAKPHVIEATGH